MMARVRPIRIINVILSLSKDLMTVANATHVILSLSKDLGVAQRRSFDFAQDDIVLGASLMIDPR
jgi:hypothetical protein